MPETRRESSGLTELVAEASRKHGVPLTMTTETAEAIGISALTLRRWRRTGRLKPFTTLYRGRQAGIPLYSPKEIREGLLIKDTIPPGPEPGFKHQVDETPPVSTQKGLNHGSS